MAKPITGRVPAPLMVKDQVPPGDPETVTGFQAALVEDLRHLPVGVMLEQGVDLSHHGG